RPAAAVRAWRRDARRHPSPNAGPVEAAFAGALGITLGGTNHYGGRIEHRARLGDGPAPTPPDPPPPQRPATLLACTAGGIARAWRPDARRHPSPNAGPVEAAFAGALGITLGGTNHYGGRIEHRARLGDGPAPTLADLPRAKRLATLIAWTAGGIAVAFAQAGKGKPREHHGSRHRRLLRARATG